MTGRRGGSATWAAATWDGARVEGTVEVAAPRFLRVGRSVFLFVDDIRPYWGSGVRVDGGVVIGPTLGAAWREIELCARSGDTLFIQGDSGTGKELAARTFHDASARAGGPFVAVNCAAVPEGVAERLLFGARRGAYVSLPFPLARRPSRWFDCDIRTVRARRR